MKLVEIRIIFIMGFYAALKAQGLPQDEKEASKAFIEWAKDMDFIEEK